MSADTNHAKWEKQLAEFEKQVAYAREVLDQGGVPEPLRDWKPPKVGRIPSDLVKRARAVQAGMQDVESRIKAAMENNRAERDRLRVLPKKKPDAKPRYIDIEG